MPTEGFCIYPSRDSLGDFRADGVGIRVQNALAAYGIRAQPLSASSGRDFFPPGSTSRGRHVNLARILARRKSRSYVDAMVHGAFDMSPGFIAQVCPRRVQLT